MAAKVGINKGGGQEVFHIHLLHLTASLKTA